jgi:hypothetical protein
VIFKRFDLELLPKNYIKRINIKIYIFGKKLERDCILEQLCSNICCRPATARHHLSKDPSSLQWKILVTREKIFLLNFLNYLAEAGRAFQLETSVDLKCSIFTTQNDLDDINKKLSTFYMDEYK